MSSDTNTLSDKPPLGGYEIVIEPGRGGLRIDWREIWEYRDLLYLLVRRDFVAKYKQTILGPAWFILQPLLMTIVFTLVFGNVAQIPTEGAPPLLFYLCGLLGWNYFAATLNTTSTTLTSNEHLFGKVYFPRMIVPFSVASSNLCAAAIQMITFLVFWVYFKCFTDAGHAISMSWGAVLLPLLYAHAALASLGVGLWMSALTAKYRDLSHIMNLLTQIWLYATPIIYPFSKLPEKWKWVSLANPMTAVVESYKTVLLGVGYFSVPTYLLSLTVALVLFATGMVAFHKVERTFIDTV